MNAIAKRVYDKGDRRVKHVHSEPTPAIVQIGNNPKLVIGKCPHGMSGQLLAELINEAIPVANAQSELTFPKRLYVVHDGAIYEAQTSDQGKSYHGYPYSGKLPSNMINELHEMAIRKGCSAAFDKWVGKYIERHGR